MYLHMRFLPIFWLGNIESNAGLELGYLLVKLLVS
jgi:hypothetical protein